MATSTSPGISATVFHAGIPATESALGLTTWMRPAKLPSTMWRTSARPMVSWRRLAPMIATDLGREEPLDRGVLGPVLALRHDADGGVGGVDPEDELHHAVLEGALHLVAGVAERVDHRLVVRQHLGDELLDAALAPGLGEVLEQQLTDPAALVLVLDEEGHLGVARADRVVAPDGDHVPGDQQDQRHPVAVVDLGEPVEVAVGELRHRREEPVVLRLVRDPAVEVDQQLRSSGCIGLMCAVRPSRSSTSASQWRGGGAVGLRVGHGSNVSAAPRPRWSSSRARTYNTVVE